MAVVVEQPNIAIHIQDAVVLQKSEKMEFLLLLPERSPSSVSTTISTSSKGSSNEPTTGSLSIGSPSSVSKKWNIGDKSEFLDIGHKSNFLDIGDKSEFRIMGKNVQPQDLPYTIEEQNCAKFTISLKLT